MFSGCTSAGGYTTAAIDVEKQLTFVFLFPPGFFFFLLLVVVLVLSTPQSVHPTGHHPTCSPPHRLHSTGHHPQAAAAGVVPSPGPLFSWSVPCCSPLARLALGPLASGPWPAVAAGPWPVLGSAACSWGLPSLDLTTPPVGTCVSKKKCINLGITHSLYL